MKTLAEAKSFIEKSTDFGKAFEEGLTHGAEMVQDEDLWYLAAAIEQQCFEKDLTILGLYYIPEYFRSKRAIGLYTFRRIMIDKVYHTIHGTNKQMADLMFHEMVHAYCNLNRIIDMDDKKHLQVFADVAEDHGGVVGKYDETYGFTNVYLKDDVYINVKREFDALRG